MKSINSVLITLFLFSLVACSRSNSTKTKLEVSNSFVFDGSATANIANGGLIIWGQAADGTAFARILQGSDSISVDLTNGSWRFYAIAWEGEGSTDLNNNGVLNENLLGKAHCGLSSATLNGEPVSVNLTIAPDNCTSSIFSGGAEPDPNNNLGLVKVELCEIISPILSASGQCTDTAGENQKALRGHTMSYRFNILEYDQTPGAAAITSKMIHSSCRQGIPTLPEGGLLEQKSAQLPVGDGASSPFRMELEFFPGSEDCQHNEYGSRKVVLPNGLKSNDVKSKYFLDTSPTAEHKIYVKMAGEEICTGSSLTNTFAGGDGSYQFPYFICSVPQLQNMVTETALDKSYKLLRNLDLNPYSKGANYPAGWTPPSWYSCLELGGNFLPIGSGLNCTTGAAFSGSFDGGHKVIKGLRMRFDDVDFVGLFKQATSGANFMHINLLRPEVSGRNYVGAILGKGSAIFRNIRITSPDVEARGDSENFGKWAGSLAGSLTGGEVENAVIRDAKISADYGDVGGLVGHFTGSGMYDILVDGEVRLNSPGGYVGGIAGFATGQLTSSRFEGRVRGTTWTGGLVGKAENLSVQYSYAHGSITGGYMMTGKLGGLVGGYSIGSPGQHGISNSYFFGKLQADCSSCESEVGAIVGDIGPLVAFDFTSAFYPTNLDFSGSGTASIWQNFFDPNFVTNEIGLSGVAGDLPRVSSETAISPCRIQPNALQSIPAQVGAQKGSTPNDPILLCNPMQLMGMQDQPGKHYRLLNHITLMETLDQPGATFSGSLDGNNKTIIGASILATGGATAWWGEVTGIIKNLRFSSPKVDSLDGEAALIANSNSGLLENISIEGLQWNSPFDGAGVINFNSPSGILRNLELEGYFAANQNVAAVALYNYGLMQNLNIRSDIYCTSGPCQYIAGVVQENTGTIKQVDLNMYLDLAPTETLTESSLIVLENAQTGIIEDITIEHSALRTTGTNAHAVAINNQGIVRRVINQAEVIFNGTVSSPETFVTSLGAGVGINAGTVTSLLFTRPAAWRIDSATPTSFTDVSGNCQVTMNEMFMLSTNWQNFITDSPSTFQLRHWDKRDYDLIAADFTNAQEPIFTVAANCTEIGSSTYFDLVHIPAVTPESAGTLADIMNWSTFANWPVWVANMEDPADASRVVAIYLAHLSGWPLPETPPVWEWSSDEGPRLFSMD